MSGEENGQVVGGCEWAAAHKSKTAKGMLLTSSAPHSVTASIASTW